MTGYQVHEFNPGIAKVYSLPAALIFHYVWLRCGKHSDKFVVLTVDEIAKQYPYMGRTAIWEGLQFLVMPSDNPGLVSRKIINGVYHYGVIPNDREYPTYKFDVRVATELGIVPAIILASIGYWVKMNWKQKAEQAARWLDDSAFTDLRAMFEEALMRTIRGANHTTTIEDWLTRHPYLSERTARRGFSCLLKKGLLEKRPGKQHKTIYTLNSDLLANYGDKLLSLIELPNSPAKLHYRPAKLHCRPAKLHQEQGLNNCAATGSKSLNEDVIHEEHLPSLADARSFKHGDAFAPSLADARSVARSASIGDFSPALRADQQAEISKLNQPSYVRLKKRSRKKRGYKRLPKPDDPEFDMYVDDLPPVEREKYLDRFR